MGPIEHGQRKAESDTRAKCRPLFEQREDYNVEQVERSNERHSLGLTSLPNGTSRSSCCHRHGCTSIDLVDTRTVPYCTSRDPVMIRILFSTCMARQARFGGILDQRKQTPRYYSTSDICGRIPCFQSNTSLHLWRMGCFQYDRTAFFWSGRYFRITTNRMRTDQ
jgi:hypothetical protein